MAFTQGHALIIGVGQYHHHPGMNVPVAVADAGAFEQVIKNQKLCGYPASQVELLSD